MEKIRDMGKKFWTTLLPKKVSEEAGDQARRILRHQSFSFLKCWKKCIFMPSISKHGYFWTLYNGIPDHHVTWPTERRTVYIMDKGQCKSERQLCLQSYCLLRSNIVQITPLLPDFTLPLLLFITVIHFFF